MPVLHKNAQRKRQQQQQQQAFTVAKIAALLAVLLWARNAMDFRANIHVPPADLALKNAAAPLAATSSTPATSTSTKQHDTSKQYMYTASKYTPIHCEHRLQTRHDTFDPNHIDDTTHSTFSRETITTPSFHIALHKEWFDRMRWNAIMKNGEYYETGLTQRFKEILEKEGTSTKGLVIDIGMNIGWFSLWARAHGHSVAAFEPNPVMHIRVCESLQLNHWDDGSSRTTSSRSNNAAAPFVQIWPYGMGNAESTLNLTTGNNPGGSSFLEDRIAKRFRKTVPVKVVTLDSVAQQEGWVSTKIDLLKVDVEGFENFVFEGGLHLLNSGRISNVIYENSSEDPMLVVELLDTMTKAHFVVHKILSVHGDDYHPEWLAPLNELLQQRRTNPPSSQAQNDNELDDILKFLIRVTCNLWWVQSGVRQ